MSSRRKLNIKILWKFKYIGNISSDNSHHLHKKLDRKATQCLSISSCQFTSPGRLTEQRVIILGTEQKEAKIIFLKHFGGI